VRGRLISDVTILGGALELDVELGGSGGNGATESLGTPEPALSGVKRASPGAEWE
jgi:hypothetical protein